MRAIIICPQPEASSSTKLPVELCPLLDSPFLHHLVDVLVAQKIRDIEFVFEAGSIVPDLVAEGTRWGARLKYHDCTGFESVYSGLRQVTWTDPEERILLAHSDRLPLVDLNAVNFVPAMFFSVDSNLEWTGWSVIRASDLEMAAQSASEAQLLAGLDPISRQRVPCGRPLTARSHGDLLDAHKRVLSGEFPKVIMEGREVKPGLWIARNAYVHPTARLIAPAFIGENARVGSMVQIGPAATIGRDCLIGSETAISDSIICSGTYVARKLVLNGVVVDRSNLVNTKLVAEIEGVDEALLGSVAGLSLRSAARKLLTRLTAGFLIVITLPILLMLYLGSMLRVVPMLRRESIVKTPTVSSRYRWREFPLWSFDGEARTRRAYGLSHFLFQFLPALFAIASGDMVFVGARPRTKLEMEQAPTTYLQLSIGILQPEMLGLKARSKNLQERDPRMSDSFRVCLRYAGAILASFFKVSFAPKGTDHE